MKEIMSVMPWLLVTPMALTIQSSAPGHRLKVWRSKPRFNVGSASLSMGSHSWMHRGSHIWRPLSWKLYLFYLPSVVAISFPGPASLHWPQELLSFFPLFFVMSAACGHCLSMVCFFFCLGNMIVLFPTVIRNWIIYLPQGIGGWERGCLCEQVS